jgi:hypothetical protein
MDTENDAVGQFPAASSFLSMVEKFKAFAMAEAVPDFLKNTASRASDGEEWTLKKVCRRFVWHDRIHGKAMTRMAAKLCGRDKIADPFFVFSA